MTQFTHTLESRTTAMGHRSHTVTTNDSEFAWALFEQALEVDIEPYRTYKGDGVYEVEFICSDSERDVAIEATQMSAGVALC